MAKKNKSDKNEVKIPKGIVILVMGPTGVGKSTFINTLLQDKVMAVHDRLTSCTVDVQEARIKSIPTKWKAYECHPLLIVDTPGFENSAEEDVATLRRIDKWLKDSHKNKIIGGVIYLHDISEDRFSGTARQNLTLFQKICGDAALDKVVLGTTKWNKASDHISESHEADLRKVHWKYLIDRGSRLQRFLSDYNSAWTFIELILERLNTNDNMFLQSDTGIKLLEKAEKDRELKLESFFSRILRFFGF